MHRWPAGARLLSPGVSRQPSFRTTSPLSMCPELCGASSDSAEARVPRNLGLCSASAQGAQGLTLCRAGARRCQAVDHVPPPPRPASPAEGAPERTECEGCH